MDFIAGAGSVNVDLLYSGMKKLPDIGEEAFSQGFSLQLGGGIPATLIHLARLGIETKLVTQLGDDLFSEFARKELNDAGANFINAYDGEEIPLTVTSAVILKNDRSFISYSGYREPDDKMKEAFYHAAKGAKIVLMQTGGYLETYRKLKEDGATLIFDSGWDDTMSLESYADYLALADYYTPNRKEALKLTGKTSPIKAAHSLQSYFSKVIIKLDKDGCLGIENGEMFTVSPITDFHPVDSTGAGDAFLAGLCYGLLKGYSFRDSILFGNITGAKAVSSIGAVSASLSENELLNIYNKYKK